MLKEHILVCKDGSVDLSDVVRAEININNERKKINIYLRKKQIMVPYRGEIVEEDIPLLEDYFNKNDIVYFIIHQN